MTAPDAVVTHHTDGFRSGVARFNELLASALSVPMISLSIGRSQLPAHPLVSLKVSELGARAGDLAALLELVPGWDVFLHELAGGNIEEELVRGASRVHAGNDEIRARLGKIGVDAEAAWTPGLLNDDRPYPEADITVFSFGMAHKLRLDMFERLRRLLDASQRTYAVYVSAANHETAALRDAEEILAQLQAIFPEGLFFLGNLSDVAVANRLVRATFFAAFFEGGVRANNTTVASALERGSVVITNLDNHSPPQYVHLESVIDIARCEALPLDEATLARLRSGAVRSRAGLTWDALAHIISSSRSSSSA